MIAYSCNCCPECKFSKNISSIVKKGNQKVGPFLVSWILQFQGLWSRCGPSCFGNFRESRTNRGRVGCILVEGERSRSHDVALLGWQWRRSRRLGMWFLVFAAFVGCSERKSKVVVSGEKVDERKWGHRKKLFRSNRGMSWSRRKLSLTVVVDAFSSRSLLKLDILYQRQNFTIAHKLFFFPFKGI